MGVADLRSSFNAIAAPAYTASMAFMMTERADGVEWSRMRFTGTKAGGEKFDVTSDRLPPGADVMRAAAQTAQKLVDETPPSSSTIITP